MRDADQAAKDSNGKVTAKRLSIRSKFASVAVFAMRPAPLFSIIVPCLNGAKELVGSLGTVSAQTLQDFEILVIDDGSGAEEARSIASIAKRAGAKLLRRSSRGGPGLARNFGAANAKGAFLALLDCDDAWLPEKLAVIAAAIKANPELDCIFHASVTIDASGVPRAVNRYAQLSRSVLVDKLLRGDLKSFTSALVVRKAWFDEIGGFSSKLLFREDHLLLLRGIREARWKCLPDVLSHRRLRADSMSAAARNPDPSAQITHAAKFLQEVRFLYPNTKLNRFRAAALHRAAKHHIVLGELRYGAWRGLQAFVVDPRNPKSLGLVAAAGVALFNPSRFDHWHPELAAVRLEGTLRTIRRAGTELYR